MRPSISDLHGFKVSSVLSGRGQGWTVRDVGLKYYSMSLFRSFNFVFFDFVAVIFLYVLNLNNVRNFCFIFLNCLRRVDSQV